MRVSPVPSYPAGFADEPDATIGFGVSAEVTVSDSGILVEARTSCIPAIVSRRPVNDADYAQLTGWLVAPDGLSALRIAAQEGRISRNQKEFILHADYLDEPITHYATTSVVTAIQPELYTISETEWVPVWRITCSNEYPDGWRD
ncbi:MAG: hypothetical protein Q4G52_02880 [Clostridia bacterium]|nr:hypothetical protein [Clostridia bacterium]